MGKILIVYYYNTECDLIAEKHYYEETFEYRYQNIMFDERANQFKGSTPKLLDLILKLTYICSSNILQEDHWKLASTLQYLWMIYFSLKDSSGDKSPSSTDYIYIDYG